VHTKHEPSNPGRKIEKERKAWLAYVPAIIDQHIEGRGYLSCTHAIGCVFLVGVAAMDQVLSSRIDVYMQGKGTRVFRIDVNSTRGFYCWQASIHRQECFL
jgi:hypothetical protein